MAYATVHFWDDLYGMVGYDRAPPDEARSMIITTMLSCFEDSQLLLSHPPARLFLYQF